MPHDINAKELNELTIKRNDKETTFRVEYNPVTEHEIRAMLTKVALKTRCYRD